MRRSEKKTGTTQGKENQGNKERNKRRDKGGARRRVEIYEIPDFVGGVIVLSCGSETSFMTCIIYRLRPDSEAYI